MIISCGSPDPQPFVTNTPKDVHTVRTTMAMVLKFHVYMFMSCASAKHVVQEGAWLVGGTSVYIPYVI